MKNRHHNRRGRVWHNFRRELYAAMTTPIAVSLVEGGFVGVLADKLFNVHPLMLALLTAAPALGNVTSLFWARLSAGRPKIRFIMGLQASILITIGSIAFIPLTPLGQWWLAAAVIVTRCLLCGWVTARTTVWRVNYPRNIRARMTGRLTMTASVLLGMTSIMAAGMLDVDPGRFRLIYVAAVLVASIGIYVYSGIIVRHEERHLREERDPGGAVRAQQAATVTADHTRRSFPGMWAVLRSDVDYRDYMGWQMLLGFSNLMLEPVLIYLVSHKLQASYLASIAITQAIPFVCIPLSMMFWARRFDRLHVSQYRILHSVCIGIAVVVVWIGALFGSLVIIGLGRLLWGLTRGGGMLAWQLGANDFASRQLVTVYMGVHVTLTGIRGAIAPFVGMLLYNGWAGTPFTGVGQSIFLISACGIFTAAAGFFRLSRRIAQKG
jgi:hypothetical protein